MRYGIVRDAPFLSPPRQQRDTLEALGCDLIMEERDTSADAIRRVERILFRMKAGDEVVVEDLHVFLKSTERLAQLLRDILELGVSVIVAATPEEQTVIAPEPSLIALLGLIATHDTRQAAAMLGGPARLGGARRSQPLSSYQISYARKLHAEGKNLRTIGLLFRISPQHVAEIVLR